MSGRPVADGRTTSTVLHVLHQEWTWQWPPPVPCDQLQRWEALNGDYRDAEQIMSVPALRGGTTYWVQDPLHALVLRQAARGQQHNAEVLWDLARQQYAVVVADTMANAWE